jgi:hypothetical protein
MCTAEAKPGEPGKKPTKRDKLMEIAQALPGLTEPEKVPA